MGKDLEGIDESIYDGSNFVVGVEPLAFEFHLVGGKEAEKGIICKCQAGV
jgi:hypothetical protein